MNVYKIQHILFRETFIDKIITDVAVNLQTVIEIKWQFLKGE